MTTLPETLASPGSLSSTGEPDPNRLSPLPSSSSASPMARSAPSPGREWTPPAVSHGGSALSPDRITIPTSINRRLGRPSSPPPPVFELPASGSPLWSPAQSSADASSAGSSSTDTPPAAPRPVGWLRDWTPPPRLQDIRADQSWKPAHLRLSPIDFGAIIERSRLRGKTKSSSLRFSFGTDDFVPRFHTSTDVQLQDLSRYPPVLATLAKYMDRKTGIALSMTCKQLRIAFTTMSHIRKQFTKCKLGGKPLSFRIGNTIGHIESMIDSFFSIVESVDEPSYVRARVYSVLSTGLASWNSIIEVRGVAIDPGVDEDNLGADSLRDDCTTDSVRPCIACNRGVCQNCNVRKRKPLTEQLYTRPVCNSCKAHMLSAAFSGRSEKAVRVTRPGGLPGVLHDRDSVDLYSRSSKRLRQRARLNQAIFCMNLMHDGKQRRWPPIWARARQEAVEVNGERELRCIVPDNEAELLSVAKLFRASTRVEFQIPPRRYPASQPRQGQASGRAGHQGSVTKSPAFYFCQCHHSPPPLCFDSCFQGQEEAEQMFREQSQGVVVRAADLAVEVQARQRDEESLRIPAEESRLFDDWRVANAEVDDDVIRSHNIRQRRMATEQALLRQPLYRNRSDPLGGVNEQDVSANMIPVLDRRYLSGAGCLESSYRGIKTPARSAIEDPFFPAVPVGNRMVGRRNSDSTRPSDARFVAEANESRLSRGGDGSRFRVHPDRPLILSGPPGEDGRIDLDRASQETFLGFRSAPVLCAMGEDCVDRRWVEIDTGLPLNVAGDRPEAGPERGIFERDEFEGHLQEVLLEETATFAKRRPGTSLSITPKKQLSTTLRTWIPAPVDGWNPAEGPVKGGAENLPHSSEYKSVPLSSLTDPSCVLLMARETPAADAYSVQRMRIEHTTAALRRERKRTETGFRRRARDRRRRQRRANRDAQSHQANVQPRGESSAQGSSSGQLHPGYPQDIPPRLATPIIDYPQPINIYELRERLNDFIGPDNPLGFGNAITLARSNHAMSDHEPESPANPESYPLGPHHREEEAIIYTENYPASSTISGMEVPRLSLVAPPGSNRRDPSVRDPQVRYRLPRHEPTPSENGTITPDTASPGGSVITIGSIEDRQYRRVRSASPTEAGSSVDVASETDEDYYPSSDTDGSSSDSETDTDTDTESGSDSESESDSERENESNAEHEFRYEQPVPRREKLVDVVSARLCAWCHGMVLVGLTHDGYPAWHPDSLEDRQRKRSKGKERAE